MTPGTDLSGVERREETEDPKLGLVVWIPSGVRAALEAGTLIAELLTTGQVGRLSQSGQQ